MLSFPTRRSSDLFVALYIRYVQVLPVRRTYNAVRLFQLVLHNDRLLCSFGKVVYPLFLYIRFGTVPVIALVVGIGEVNAALGVYPQVIGTIEAAALEIAEQYGHLFVRANGP